MSTGGGNIPPSRPGSHIPVVTGPQPPSSSGTGGIEPHTKPNALPGGQSETADTPIGQRRTVPTATATQLSRLKALEGEYHEQFNQVLSFQAQHDFLNFIPSLQQRLHDPSQFQDDLPFEIVYVKDGKMTSVLPPDPDLPKDSEEAARLRKSLQEKLTVIDQKNGPEEKRALREQIEDSTTLLGHIGREIEDAGGTVPAPPIPNITLVIDENQFTARAPARRFNPDEARHKQKDQGQFLMIPKSPSRRMSPPVATKSFRSVPIPDEGTSIRSAEIQPPPPAPVVSDVELVERELPVNGEGQYSDIYLTRETEADYGKTGNIASVNAGSVDLVFGKKASGINARFGEFFTDTQQEAIEEVQKDFLETASQEEYTGDVFAGRELTDNTPLAAMYGFVSKESDNQGTVLVSVFRDEHCPAGIKKNRAMIYVVPPKGSNENFLDKNDFLANVRMTAKNVVATQNKYNHWAAKKDHPTLPVLRTCAFGGDIYRHPDANQPEVAKAIREGIADYFHEISPDQNTIREVQYEHGV